MRENGPLQVSAHSVRNGHKPSLAAAESGLPADRALGFAQAARERTNGALLRCEEHHPLAAPHSVLYVVVRHELPLWNKHLSALHQEFFDPEQTGQYPVRLQVVDGATDEALQQLMAAGVVSRTTRATRSLWPAQDAEAPPLLSDAEQARADAYRVRAARKLRMAAVLSAGDLREEALQAMMDAIEPLGCALAVENQAPEPHCLEDALLPPLAAAWKDALPLIRAVLREPTQPLAPVLSALGRV